MIWYRRMAQPLQALLLPVIERDRCATNVNRFYRNTRSIVTIWNTQLATTAIYSFGWANI